MVEGSELNYSAVYLYTLLASKSFSENVPKNILKQKEKNIHLGSKIVRLSA